MKKLYPLSLFQTLHPIYEKNTDVLEQLKPNGKNLFYLKDKDPKSDFFFEVNEQREANGIFIYTFTKYPYTKDKIKSVSGAAEVNALKAEVENWINVIREFNETITVFDDPILKTYEERFAQRFEIVDEDADIIPFDLDRQILLDEYLATTEYKIELLIAASEDEEEIKDLEELRAAAVEIRKNVTKQPKRKVVQGFVKFWAKAQKMGLPILKELFMESAKELTKWIVGEGVKHIR